MVGFQTKLKIQRGARLRTTGLENATSLGLAAFTEQFLNSPNSSSQARITRRAMRLRQITGCEAT